MTDSKHTPRIRPTHEAADAFWAFWRENGETHKHGYYESTWGAINAALRVAGLTPAPDTAAERDRLREALQWQPIETAPRDGCDVWLGRLGRMEIGFWGKIPSTGPRGGKRTKQAWVSLSGPTPYEGDFEVDFIPTHWMPLPDPPKQGEQS
jgi:hypothetical protein